MNKNKQVLTVEPSDVVIDFTAPTGQNTLIALTPNIINVSVSNKSAYVLNNVTLKQSDIQVLYDDGRGNKPAPEGAFQVMVPGSSIVFSTVPASSTTQNTQGFFVTPTQEALTYADGKTKISFAINSNNITYDVVADTGGQSTSVGLLVTTRG
ncbi:hypothetical protein WMF38_24690 [Sorangium sp. So ce118]